MKENRPPIVIVLKPRVSGEVAKDIARCKG